MVLNTFSRATTRISAVVTRADGTVEDLGLISFSHPNPIIHWAVNSYIKIKRFF